MRCGLELPCGGEGVTLDLLLRLVVEAEAVGWDGVFLEDYLVYHRGAQPSTHDAWTVLALAAVRTSRVVLGTSVSGLLARDPVRLARQVLTVAELAPGRVVLGVGLGDPADRGPVLSPDTPATGPRGQRMDERLDRLLDLLGGGEVGDPPTWFGPSREDADRVPVWVGGSAQAGAVVTRAARADGLVPYKLSDVVEWSDFTAEEVAALVDGCASRRRGRPAAFDVAVGGRRRLLDEHAERRSVQQAADGGATWWLEFVHPGPADEMLAAVRRGPVRPADRPGVVATPSGWAPAP